MTWLQQATASFEQTFLLRENLYRDYQAFEETLNRQLEARLRALCKARCLQLHRCAVDRDSEQTLGDETLAVLPQWYNDGRFNSAEKAALQLAECFCLDPHSISDEMAAAVVDALGDAGFVALLEHLALCDGFARFRRILEIGEDA